MRIMCDTNIILDVLLDRPPFAENSCGVLALCEARKLEGFVSASVVTDIFYLVRKQTHSTELAYRAVGKLLEIVKVCGVTGDDVFAAFQKKPGILRTVSSRSARGPNQVRLYCHAEQSRFRRFSAFRHNARRAFRACETRKKKRAALNFRGSRSPMIALFVPLSYEFFITTPSTVSATCSQASAHFRGRRRFRATRLSRRGRCTSCAGRAGLR